MHHVKQLINGQFVDSNTSEWIDITDPATQEVIAKVPQTTDDEINQAVADAIAQTGASSMQEMGKVMGVLKGALAGKADMSKVSALIKAQLS